MAGGVSGYAAISARVRAMYSSLLSPQDFARLSDSPDFPTLIAQLKTTAYGPYLQNLKDRDLTPQKVDLAIKGRLADSFPSLLAVPGYPQDMVFPLEFAGYKDSSKKPLTEFAVLLPCRGRPPLVHK